MPPNLDYPPPLDQLLRLGETDLGTEWADYKALGIGPEHVPDLIRMATDAELVLASDEEGADDPLGWAPEHALRAIGQVGTAEAAGPLLEGLDRMEDIHDFWVQDLGDVWAALGPGVLPAIEAYLEDDSKEQYCHHVVIEDLPKVAAAHPEARDRVLGILTDRFARHAENDPALNGFLVAALLDLEAVEAAPLLEAAFDAGNVDETIAGDWPEVRYELGLGPKPESRIRTERRIAELERGRSVSIPPGRGRPDLKKLKQQQKRQKKGRKRGK